MADLYTYVSPSGVIIPDTADIQGDVEQEYRDALGQNLNVTQGPQQVLIAGETTSRANVLRAVASVANMINPDLAAGVFLDALWKLTGGARRGQTQSYAAAVALTGQPGTLVPAGSVAATAAGDQFASVADVTLGAGGTAAVDFRAVAFGPVPCASGALVQVVSAVLGWETVTNPTAAAVGQSMESDPASRQRRRKTLALQGVALPEAITSALYNVPGVQSLSFRENKGAAATVDGVNMLANSIWACVNGGTDADIAAAILANASLGCLFSGGQFGTAVTVNVTEAASGQVYPVSFCRPTPTPVLARAYVRASGVVGDPVALVQSAIMDFVNGQQDGEGGFVVGGSVSPFELASAVNRETPGLYVQRLEVTLASVINYQPTEVAMALNQLATLTASGITVYQV